MASSKTTASSRRQEIPANTIAQSQRSGAYMDASAAAEGVAPLSRRAKKAAESARMAAADPQPPQNTSRIPQTSSRRAATPQTYAWKQTLTQQHRPGDSNASDVSGKTTTTSTSSASSIPSSRSQESARQPRNVLRRKQPAAAEQAAGKQHHARSISSRSESTSSVPLSQSSLDISRDGPVDRCYTDSPASIRVAQRVELPTGSAQPVTIYPELDRYRDFKPQTMMGHPHLELPYPITTDLPPPTPLFSSTSSQHSAWSGSPSTRFSESPGGGPYSRDTTPTSMSSVSPGLVAPMRLPLSRSKQTTSPAETRPPVTRRRAASSSHEVSDVNTDRDGLAAVRESSNSSSSGSTIRAAAFIRDQQQQQQQKSALPRGAAISAPRSSSEHAYNQVRGEAEGVTHPSREIAGSPLSRATPPIRPSREGITDLQSQIGLPLPVVHSNLSSTSLSERRRSGQNMPTPTALSSAPRIGREPTPAPHAAASGPDPPLAKQVSSRAPTRTPSPSVSSSLKSRFPLFGRRNKSTTPAEKKEKQPRKGPAAGTGHEGYGRLGQVRRRSSNLTNALRAIPGTMSSQESLASTLPSDPFLAERMSPVVIAGGEIIHNRNVSSDLDRSESNQSMAQSRPSLSASRNNSDVSVSSQEARNTLWPSALPRGGATAAPFRGHRRLPSDSSDSDVLTMKPTLAVRRSMQRLKTSNPASARVPKPITVRPGTTTPSINSYDTTLMSDDSTLNPRPSMGRTDSEASVVVPKKLTKRPKSPRKWNIFGRSTTQLVSSSKKKTSEASQVSAKVTVVEKQPMAFYTMIDSSEQEEETLADVEDVLREAQASRPPSPKPVAAASEGTRPQPAAVLQNRSQESQQNVTVRPGQPKTTLQQPRRITTVQSSRNLRNAPSQACRVPQPPVTTSKPPSARPSRLPQVGRIPKVAGRSEPPPPSPRSFSRPFNRSSVQLQSPADNQKPAEEPVAKGPSPPEPPKPVQEPAVQEPPQALTTDELSSGSSPRASHDLQAEVSPPQREFMVFPPRKSLEGTSSTDSSCSGKLNYSEATAVVPDPNAPLAEDEVWDEYNDLLGEDVSRGHPSTSSSLGRPFHLEVWGRRLAKTSTGQPLETPIINGNMGAQMNAQLDAAESDCETEFEFDAQYEVEQEEQEEAARQTSSSVYSSDTTAKINEVLEAAGAPKSSPFSLSEFVSGYGSSTNSVEVSRPASHRMSTASSSQKGLPARHSHTSSSSQGSDDHSTTAQVNLRVGSMTVSKWLTFGHVLFSPVRDELVPVVGSLKRHSILVIDGLGNDDWSFYAAETYPAATFFNLSPRAPLPTPEPDARSSFPLSPPNHHQIQFKSHADKLPFGPQSFTCVVYRFPAAAPESHYRNVINEARRVLKPGGYIELSILDVDMNNMGNHARRAVRRLKERIHIRAPEISLGSSSDLILRLLGRKGFTDIKTCRVGVPLASATAPSPPSTDNKMDSSSSSSSSSRAAAGTSSASRGPATAAATTRRRSKKETRSLAEMMNAEGPGADEGITKMVAKVGRWWYERCYESVAPDGRGKTMWSDQALLAECEEWQTSLKLMVCHARIPDRSRVASI